MNEKSGTNIIYSKKIKVNEKDEHEIEEAEKQD